MKETITARLYQIEHKGQNHELTAVNAGDLVAQVQGITGSRQAAQLARLVWGDDAADVTAAGVRLLAVGRVVRQVWRATPQQRRSTPAPSRREANPPTDPPDGDATGGGSVLNPWQDGA